MERAQLESVTSEISASFEYLRAAQNEYYEHLSGLYTAPSGITNSFQELSKEELEEIRAVAVDDEDSLTRRTLSIFISRSGTPGDLCLIIYLWRTSRIFRLLRRAWWRFRGAI